MGVAACLRWELRGRMANLTSTHRHDYRWPGENCITPRAEAPNGHCVRSVEAGGDRNSSKIKLPWCGRERPPPLTPQAPKQTVHVCNDLVPTDKDSPWCQRGLIVEQIRPREATTAQQNWTNQPLSSSFQQFCKGDDAVVSARVGAAPQQDTSRYDQPNQYLQKLCDKFPQPIAVINATPRDELVRRVYADRYRTTYQADFCTNAHDTAIRMEDCDSHSKMKGIPLKGGVTHTPCQCGCQIKADKPTTQPTTQNRPLACRPAAVSQNFHFSCCTPKKIIVQSSNAEEVGPSEKIPPWTSEYSYGIGRTAQLIMKQKLLYPKKKQR